MSQAKVDKYKEEKKNRKKTLKKQKRKQVAEVILCAAVIGALVGVPLGRYIYKLNYEKRQAAKTVTAQSYDLWAQQYWGANYSEMFNASNVDDLLASYTDASESDATMTDSQE